MKTLSEQLVSFFVQKRVQNSFAVVGGAIEGFTNAISKSPIIEYYPTSENSAVHAASQNYTDSGIPSVVFSTTGTGILSLTNALGNAYCENKKVFVIVPQESLFSHDKGSFQSSRYGNGINTVNILREITCYADEVTSHEHLEQKVNLAWNKMQEFCQPVALSVPSNILNAKMEGIKVYPEPEELHDKFFFDSFDHNDCIVVGENCEEEIFEIVNLANLKNIPLIDVPKSRGLLPYNTKNYKGMIGMAGNQEAKETIDKSNRILFINGEVTETNIGKSNDWLDKTILINNNRDYLYRGRNKNYLIPKSELKDIINTTFYYNDYQFKEEFVINDKELNLKSYNNEDQVTTPMLMDYLSHKLPKNTESFFDTGNSFLFGLNAWRVNKDKTNSKKTFNLSIIQATMAWAIPSLYGAMINNPNKTYMCMTGDGSFNMGSNDLSAISKIKSNAVIVVLNDGVMGMVMHGQRLAQAAPTGFQNHEYDYKSIAKASNMKSFIVNNYEDLKSIPLDLKEPILIDARINKEIQPPIKARIEQLEKGNNND